MAGKRQPATPARHRERWTRAEEQQLRQEARRNMDTDDMAATHQRTENAIRSKADELDISLAPPDKD